MDLMWRQGRSVTGVTKIIFSLSSQGDDATVFFFFFFSLVNLRAPSRAHQQYTALYLNCGRISHLWARIYDSRGFIVCIGVRKCQQRAVKDVGILQWHMRHETGLFFLAPPGGGCLDDSLSKRSQELFPL
jgi:hypothetical protein